MGFLGIGELILCLGVVWDVYRIYPMDASSATRLRSSRMLPGGAGLVTRRVPVAALVRGWWAAWTLMTAMTTDI